MRCLSLWYGIGEHLVTSKERLSVAAKQLVDDSGKLLDQKCLPKKNQMKRDLYNENILHI